MGVRRTRNAGDEGSKAEQGVRFKPSVHCPMGKNQLLSVSETFFDSFRTSFIPFWNNGGGSATLFLVLPETMSYKKRKILSQQ